MKKDFTIYRSLIKAFVLVLLFVPSLLLNAQTVLSDIRINSLDINKLNLDGGGNQMAVLNDSIYVIWQGESAEDIGNIYFTRSTDGGISFATEKIIAQGSATVYDAFPSLAVTQAGTIHMAWCGVTNNESAYNIWYAKSEDNGVSFSAPVHITTNNAAVFPAIGASGNNVYILYADASQYPKANYYFARSADGGSTFETPVQVNDAECKGTVKFEGLTNILVDPSGNLYLAWVDGRRADGSGDICLAKSTDQGQSFAANVIVNDTTISRSDSAQYLPVIASDGANNVYVSFADISLGDDWSNNRVYLAKSTDGGTSFATEALLAGHDATCKYHSLAVNASGKLYAALCSSVSSGWGTWLFESDNEGVSFAEPVALSSVINSMGYDDVRLASGMGEEVYALWKDARVGADIYNLYFTKTDVGTGNKEMSSRETLIYPNPTQGKIYINAPQIEGSYEISIYNSHGQRVLSRVVESGLQVVIDMDLASGVYFVNIKQNHLTKTFKLVKQ